MKQKHGRRRRVCYRRHTKSQLKKRVAKSPWPCSTGDPRRRPRSSASQASWESTPSSSPSRIPAAVDLLESELAILHTGRRRFAQIRPRRASPTLHLVSGEPSVRLDYFSLSFSLWSVLAPWATVRRSWASSPATLRKVSNRSRRRQFSGYLESSGSNALPHASVIPWE
jgi:hypothetical protein